MPFIAIAVALFIALGGTVAVESAQPGDALFETKSAINSALHINSQADVEADTDVHASSTNSYATSSVNASGSVRANADAHATIGNDSEGQNVLNVGTQGQGTVDVH